MALSNIQIIREVKKLNPGVGGAALRKLVADYKKSNKLTPDVPKISTPKVQEGNNKIAVQGGNEKWWKDKEKVQTPQVAGYTAKARVLTKNEILDAMDEDPAFDGWSMAKKRSVASGYLDPNRTISDTWRSQLENAISPYMASKGMQMDGDGGVIPVTSGDATGTGTDTDTGTEIGDDSGDAYKDEQDRMKEETALQKERMANAMKGIDDALARGEITPDQARAFKIGLQSWDPSKEINMENIISEFGRIQSETIDPQFKYVIGDTIQQLQSAKTELDRSKQQRLEGTQQSLEARGMTFSGEGVKQLGELGAFGQEGQQGELQKDYSKNLEGIRRLAEQKLGSERAQQIGFEPLQGGFEGTIQQDRAGVEAGVASSLYGQEQYRGATQAPISQQYVPENLYTL